MLCATTSLTLTHDEHGQQENKAIFHTRTPNWSKLSVGEKKSCEIKSQTKWNKKILPRCFRTVNDQRCERDTFCCESFNFIIFFISAVTQIETSDDAGVEKSFYRVWVSCEWCKLGEASSISISEVKVVGIRTTETRTTHKASAQKFAFCDLLSLRRSINKRHTKNVAAEEMKHKKRSELLF